tara:strand:+ start:700 stop:831 length:132 start_codon:yes stop_codon:yes gene_type:complete
MINAWSLAAEILEDTLDETYPIKSEGGEPPIIDKRFENNSDNQ